MRVMPDGSLQVVEKYVTGTRGSQDPAVPGTNAYAIDITPDGRFLANTHATAISTFEQITLWRVHADGTLTQIGTALTPDSPLDLVWVTNDLLAVTRTQFGGQNFVIMYRFDENNVTLTEIDRKQTPGFTAYVEAHPTGRWVYAGESTSNSVSVYEVGDDGRLTLIQTAFPGNYAIDPTVSHDGTKLYVAGGISAGGRSIAGFHIGSDGILIPMDNSPWISPGDSPKEFAFSTDDRLLYVSHGRDATVWSFYIDPFTGDLQPTGNMFDVGLQGSHGDTVTLEGLVFFSDDTTAVDGIMGIYSFDVTPDGNFLNQNGPVASTLGIAPEHLVAWEPARCRADLSGSSDPNHPMYGVPDGDVDGSDFFYFLDQFVAGNLAVADLSGSTDPNDPGYGFPDGQLDGSDFFYFLDIFVAGCP